MQKHNQHKDKFKNRKDAVSYRLLSSAIYWRERRVAGDVNRRYGVETNDFILSFGSTSNCLLGNWVRS